VSIGESLAEGRRQAVLTITQVSQRTRIRESIIRAIEQGDFSACGGDFYARGHIRSIASAVGMDPAPLIQEYDETHEPPGSISAAEVFEPSKPIKISEPRSFGLGKVMIAALLVVIGFGVYHLVSSSGSHHPQAGAYTSAADQSTAKPSPAKPSPKASKVRTVAVDPVSAISITANENCWVEITRPNGTEVYNQTIQAGETVRWSERQKVFVQLGNPGGVVLKVDGHRADLHTTMPIVLTVAPGHGAKVLGPSGTVQIPVASAAG
jgi:cytoskeletal protein RodZ